MAGYGDAVAVHLKGAVDSKALAAFAFASLKVASSFEWPVVARAVTLAVAAEDALESLALPSLN